MEACIKYVAINSEQPDVLADFYIDHFAMTELDRYDGNIALTDGFYNLSILKVGERHRTPGFSHIGIAIDDLHELVARVEEFASPQTRLLAERLDSFHGEYRIFDPNWIPVSLSTCNFGVPEDELRLPAIRHIAYSVTNNKVVADFFTNIFGFRQTSSPGSSDTERMDQHAKRDVADGMTSFQLLVCPVRTSDVDPTIQLGPRHTRWGLNHIGWLVPDLELTLKTLPEGTVHQRPAIRSMAEYRGYDPDCNEFDVSYSKGYRVDAGVLAKANGQ